MSSVYTYSKTTKANIRKKTVDLTLVKYNSLAIFDTLTLK